MLTHKYRGTCGSLEQGPLAYFRTGKNRRKRKRKREKEIISLRLQPFKRLDAFESRRHPRVPSFLLSGHISLDSVQSIPYTVSTCEKGVAYYINYTTEVERLTHKVLDILNMPRLCTQKQKRAIAGVSILPNWLSNLSKKCSDGREICYVHYLSCPISALAQSL